MQGLLIPFVVVENETPSASFWPIAVTHTHHEPIVAPVAAAAMSRSRTIAAVTLLACIIGVHLPSEVHCVEAVASTKAPPADEAANQAATGANIADKAAPASPTALTLPYNETKARRYVVIMPTQPLVLLPLQLADTPAPPTLQNVIFFRECLL